MPRALGNVWEIKEYTEILEKPVFFEEN